MKKMRKLIPAFAMLMVAAIMMTTASFAWFTMNDEVKVTGLQIKAEADGSLVVSKAPIYAGNLGNTTADFEAGIKNFKPITFNEKTAAGEDPDENNPAMGWAWPETSANNNFVTGAAGANLKKLAETELDGLIFEEELYIATSGEAMTGKKLKVELSLGSSATGLGNAHNAYAVAIYYIPKTVDGEANDLWENEAKPAYDAVPNEIIYIDSRDNNVVLNTDAIPSLAGAVDEASAVGLKVVLRFFVDGALKAPNTIKVMQGNIYTAAVDKAYSNETNYVKIVAAKQTVTEGETVVDTFYTATGMGADGKVTANTVFTPAAGKAKADTDYYALTISAAVADDSVTTSGKVPADWYTAAANMVDSEYTYVRSQDVPGAGVALEIKFSAVASN